MIPTPRLEELRDAHATHAQDWADVRAAPMAKEALDTALALEELRKRRAGAWLKRLVLWASWALLTGAVLAASRWTG